MECLRSPLAARLISLVDSSGHGLLARGTLFLPSNQSLLCPFKMNTSNLIPDSALPKWRQISIAEAQRYIFPLEMLIVYPRKKEIARKCSLRACTFSRS